jgi:hypothetical protein
MLMSQRRDSTTVGNAGLEIFSSKEVIQATIVEYAQIDDGCC